MTYQLRNWPYFTWLSGDHIVEQAIHSIDKMSWAMQDEPPIKATGLGGRQSRTGPEFGHIFDHHSVTYEFASGAKCFSMCRQQENCLTDVSDSIYGTGGVATLLGSNKRNSWVITGAKAWRVPRGAKEVNMYQQEHDELFASIRAGTPLNQIESTLADRGQMLAFEPMDLGPATGGPAGVQTIGGVFAVNLSGPRRIASGASRDHLLGVVASAVEAPVNQGLGRAAHRQEERGQRQGRERHRDRAGLPGQAFEHFLQPEHAGHIHRAQQHGDHCPLQGFADDHIDVE